MLLRGSQVVCRVRDSRESDLEDLFRLFLLESFESKEGVWIISPWVSNFCFRQRLAYFPYVVSNDAVEILGELSKITSVHVLTRCFDDFLPIELLHVIYRAYDANEKLPSYVVEYFYESISESLRRLRSLENVVESGVDLKTDIDMKTTGRRIPSRLHAKLYVNHAFAIIGSANFTYMGVSKDGNIECAMVVVNGSESYSVIKEYAKKLFDLGRPYEECTEAVLEIANRALGDFGVRLRDVDDLKSTLDDLQRYLKRLMYR